MNYHIVRTNDKLNTIINLYNLTIDEVKDLNKHISNWDNLIPGTRIKLPVISEAVADELNDIEPFIEDYYPKIDLKRYESKDEEEDSKVDELVQVEESQVIEENESIYNKEEKDKEKIKNSNFTNSIKLPYSYYYNPYDYYRRRKTK